MFLKVVLFWFQGRGRPYKGGTPYVVTDSKSLILGLSNEVSFVSKLSAAREIQPKTENWPSTVIGLTHYMIKHSKMQKTILLF